ncbi:putative 4-hydroxy-4-methyl-2-oxoglutarate aldolase [Thalassotalea profundi]|uniref:4-hydroxy-4-methyl-2-oxoglutarate aldolase n=1 Tax=Thalassotalea profundi TaxID=2036687 RepID=A0ABQ3IHS2_9GAMM|nr:putative 4-hydroxy-4-methyl-2-oxoglutarate aldolase [Thalassotalea profundi]GHE84906.1 putative 4-hydroxy-4-methyl-2-oxoglutarate aldolase [Thalassotalea profundi]
MANVFAYPALDLLPDLCDLYPDDTKVLAQQFNDYGQIKIFHGQVVTIKCFEDNSLVKSILAQDGKGKVLVVDGGALTRKALLGDLIAESAIKNNWQGVVINGFIRDVATINSLNIGVKALGTTPIKTEKRGLGDLNTPVNIAGVNIRPNDWLYADENGVLIAKYELVLPNNN